MVLGLGIYIRIYGFPCGSDSKASACSAGDPGSIPGSGDPLEKEMATHSSILAWKIPWTEKTGSLQSVGSQRVRHDWVTSLDFTSYIYISGKFGVCAKLLQLCLTLCDPIQCSPLGSSVCGILQPRILEWVAMPSSRGSSWCRGWTYVSYVFCIGRQLLYH